MSVTACAHMSRHLYPSTIAGAAHLPGPLTSIVDVTHLSPPAAGVHGRVVRHQGIDRVATGPRCGRIVRGQCGLLGHARLLLHTVQPVNHRHACEVTLRTLNGTVTAIPNSALPCSLSSCSALTICV